MIKSRRAGVLRPVKFLACLALWLAGRWVAEAAPVVFWSPDSVEPGNVVLVYGGGLATATTTTVWRLPDGDAGQPDNNMGVAIRPPGDAPSEPVIQPVEYSAKFVLPAAFKPGVYAAQVDADGQTAPVPLLNRPECWFVQPTVLQPGLDQNQAAVGATVQLIGKNFLLPGDIGQARVVLVGADQAPRELVVSNAERFSLRVQLPPDLAAGPYNLWVHNGFGGRAGWGGPLPVAIKAADHWPDKVFNVKTDFGAKGDDTTDDTAALQQALAAAETNGGGIVYLPWGIYRVSHWLALPPHTILRGDNRDASVLMWPADPATSFADFTPAAIYGFAPYAVEDLTIIARKVDTLFVDSSFPPKLPPELAGKKPAVNRDVFFRRVNFQHWLLASHPDRLPELWNTRTNASGTGLKAGKFDGDGAHILSISGVTNFELSACQAQGGQIHLRNLVNARETGNLYGNEMGYCWTEMGGGAHFVVSEGNEIRASSSWGYNRIGMQYVYSAHNQSYNFVRGEREAMTLDISALPATGEHGNITWIGKPTAVAATQMVLNGIKAADNEFAGMAVVILDGPGVGQYRVVTSNTPTVFSLEKPWDVAPDTNSTIGVWQLMRHMIVYKCEGRDCSAFAQLYGSFYDYIVDSCHVERNQGIWGQSGWFVQFRYNDVLFANTYHTGIGPAGGKNPEKTLPFSFVGLTDGILRITKFGSAQYGKKLVMVDEVADHPIAGVHGAIVKGNHLEYNQRVAFPPSFSVDPHAKKPVRMYDVVVDGNHIEHSPVGVQIGAEVRGAVISDNTYADVAEVRQIAKPETVQVLGREGEGK